MITNQVDKASYSGNGSNTNFAIPFTIVVSDQAEVGVILRDITNPSAPVDTPQVFGAGQNYTLSGANPPTSPFNTTVVMNVAPTSNQIVVVYRIMPFTQLLNMLTNNFDFSNLNVVHDRLVAMVQVLNEALGRMPSLAQATQKTPAQMIVPEPPSTASSLGWNPVSQAWVWFSQTIVSGAIQALTGDVASSGGTTATTTIQPGVVTLAKIAAAAYSASPLASVLALFDANKNLSANNHIEGFATTVSAAGTVVLTTASAWLQTVTGSTTESMQLPVATTMAQGQGFYVVNASSGVMTLKTSAGTTIKAMAASSTLLIWCSNPAGGTGTASWNWQYIAGLNN